MMKSYTPNYFVWGQNTSSKYDIINQIISNLSGEDPETIPVIKYEDKDYDFFIKKSEKCICFANVFRASYDVTLVNTILNLFKTDAPIENLIAGKKVYRVYVIYNSQFLSKNALKIIGNYMKKTQHTYNRIILETDTMSVLTDDIAPYVEVRKITDNHFMRDVHSSTLSEISKSQSDKFSLEKFLTKEQTVDQIVDLLLTSSNNISSLFNKIQEVILTLWTSNLDYVQLLKMIFTSFSKKKTLNTNIKLSKILEILIATDILMKKDCYNDYTHIQNMIYQIYCLIHII